MTNEEIVRRYCEALARRDFETSEALRHPGWTCEWPQSGERVASSAAMRAITEHYPGGGWQARERRLTGSQDEFVMTPAGTISRIAGAGDAWTAEWVDRYPGGSDWYVIDVLELQDGRVLRETTYWAPVYEAPAWRREWVELLGDGRSDDAGSDP
jgi:ketosteroid isomerase-like protein